MFWLIGLTVVCFMLAATYALRANAFRFALRIGREVEAFGPLQPSAAPVDEVRFDRLPEPVRRYASMVALEHAAALARPSGAVIDVLHVWDLAPLSAERVSETGGDTAVVLDWPATFR
jgi:hypothetical protein